MMAGNGNGGCVFVKADTRQKRRAVLRETVFYFNFESITSCNFIQTFW